MLHVGFRNFYFIITCTHNKEGIRKGSFFCCMKGGGCRHYTTHPIRFNRPKKSKKGGHTKSMGGLDSEKSGYGRGGLLFEIYDQMISEGQEAKKAGDHIQQYVGDMTTDTMETKDSEEAEEWEGLIYTATGKALQEGFCLGMRFAARRLLELVSGMGEG